MRLIIHLQKTFQPEEVLVVAAAMLQLHYSPLTAGTMNLLLKKNCKNLGTNWVLMSHFSESKATLATGRGNILRSLQNYPLGEILLVIPLSAYPQ